MAKDIFVISESHKGHVPWNKGMKNEYKKKRKEAS